MMPTDLVSMSVTVDGHVADLTLLGPSPGNAMGPDFFAELPQVMSALDDDPAVRAVVVSGSGGHFSYGLDLVGMADLFEDLLTQRESAAARLRFHQHLRRLQDAISAVAECRTPVVAAISGWCIGGGVDLISAADVRIASSNATFSVREARMAIVADIGSLQRLVGVVGDGHLRELALTGDDIDAERAHRIGLVNDVYADEDALRVAAHDLAGRIAANSPLVSRGIKEVLDLERAPRVANGLRHVAAWNSAFLPSDDLIEALAAFRERRPAEFTGQ